MTPQSPERPLPQAGEQPSDERILHLWDTHVGSVSETWPLSDLDKLRFARAVLAARPVPQRLWLWKNFVGGRPEYWAFDNPYPCVSVGGDPLTLGEPCGYALVKASVNGRPNRSEEEAYRAMVRAAAPCASLPEFDRDTDGELLIDWSPCQERMLTLTLRADGRLSYAFQWDGERAHGTAQMPAPSLPATSDAAPEEKP